MVTGAALPSTRAGCQPRMHDSHGTGARPHRREDVSLSQTCRAGYMATRAYSSRRSAALPFFVVCDATSPGGLVIDRSIASTTSEQGYATRQEAETAAHGGHVLS